MSVLPPPLASPTDQSLLDLLSEQEAEEKGVIDAYLTASDQAPDEIRYLIGLILQDEQRHQELVREMQNAVHADIEYHPIEPRVPRVTSFGRAQPELLAFAERLLDLERNDLKKLRRFRRRLRRQRNGSLFSVIVEQMEFDTRKHIALLQHIHTWARNPANGWSRPRPILAATLPPPA